MSEKPVVPPLKKFNKNKRGEKIESLPGPQRQLRGEIIKTLAKWRGKKTWSARTAARGSGVQDIL